MTISPNLLETLIDAPDEKDLALAFKRGEKGAYQTIHETYAPRVHGVCRRMLVSREDAEEAAQETFLRVYQALGRFNGRYQLGAWITRIATNVCLDHLRSRSRKPKFAEATAELMDLQTNLDYEDSEPETLMMRDSESRQVRRVLAALPPMHRAAIVLREYEGLSYEEIAAALGITDCQVKALIHRARQNFKKSWVRQLAQALVPAGLLSRLRRFSSVGRGSNSSTPAQLAEVVTPSMNTVASCAAFAQQCGQALADRLAPVAMAALLGGAGTLGATSAAAQNGEELNRPPAVAEETPTDVVKHERMRQSIPADDPVGPDRSVTAPQDTEPEDAPATDGPAAESETEQPAAPGSTPATPAPQPTPTQGPSSGTGAQSPPSEPEGFSLSMTTSWGLETPMCPDCGLPTAVVSESGSRNGDGLGSFSQVVTGIATNGGAAEFGARVTHGSADMQHHDLNVVLRTSQGTYEYRGTGGVLTGTTQTEWGRYVYTFEGKYELGGRPCRCEAMPMSGTYRVEITFSPNQQRLVATNVSL